MSNSGPVGSKAIVKWNAATKVFAGVYLHIHGINAGAQMIGERATHITSYGLIRPCWTASCKPNRALFSSSRQRTLNGNAPAFF